MKTRGLNPFEEANAMLWEEQTVCEDQVIYNVKKAREKLVNKLYPGQSVEDKKVMKVFRGHAISKIDGTALGKFYFFEQGGLLGYKKMIIVITYRIT